MFIVIIIYLLKTLDWLPKAYNKYFKPKNVHNALLYELLFTCIQSSIRKIKKMD